MKMVKNPVIHEVLAKQYLRSILDISVLLRVRERGGTLELTDALRVSIALKEVGL